MKKNKFLLLASTLILLSGCQKFHTGKVVVEDSKDDDSINVEYIVVEKADKESLIKNIKDGKGAIINRSKLNTNNSEVNVDNSTNGNSTNNNSTNNNR